MSKTRTAPRTVVGIVTGNRMEKTIVVQRDRTVQHKLYRKHIRKPQVFKAHDEKNEARVGARVKIMAARPLSKTKQWRLVEILDQGPEE